MYVKILIATSMQTIQSLRFIYFFWSVIQYLFLKCKKLINGFSLALGLFFMLMCIYSIPKRNLKILGMLFAHICKISFANFSTNILSYFYLVNIIDAIYYKKMVSMYSLHDYYWHCFNNIDIVRQVLIICIDRLRAHDCQTFVIL